jgi:hypothetical protein
MSAIFWRSNKYYIIHIYLFRFFGLLKAFAYYAMLHVVPILRPENPKIKPRPTEGVPEVETRSLTQKAAEGEEGRSSPFTKPSCERLSRLAAAIVPAHPEGQLS